MGDDKGCVPAEAVGLRTGSDFWPDSAIIGGISENRATQLLAVYVTVLVLVVDVLVVGWIWQSDKPVASSPTIEKYAPTLTRQPQGSPSELLIW